MRLIQVPGATGYRVDLENQQAYSMKSGILRPISFRTKYKKAVIHIGGKAYGTTLYRMLYCAQNNTDITKIPSDICISQNNGKLTVMDRAQVKKKSDKARKLAQPQIDRLQANIDLIKQYYMGHTKPMLDYLRKAEKQVAEHYIFMYGFSKERAEIVVGIAVNKVLDRLREGFPNPHIKGMIFRYARNESNRLMRQKELFDERQIIEIA
jgi:hypothetical protein